MEFFRDLCAHLVAARPNSRTNSCTEIHWPGRIPPNHRIHRTSGDAGCGAAPARMDYSDRALGRIRKDQRVAVGSPYTDPQSRLVGDERIALSQAAGRTGLHDFVGVDLVKRRRGTVTEPVAGRNVTEAMLEPVERFEYCGYEQSGGSFPKHAYRGFCTCATMT
jgi:hypothetical protein